jgi:hypothetical protein
MDFVSKEQAFQAAKRLLAEQQYRDLAGRMEFKDFENAISADPLSPRDALCAVGDFLADNAASDGNAGLRKPRGRRRTTPKKTMLRCGTAGSNC